MPYQALLSPQLKTALQRLERDNRAQQRRLRQEIKGGSPLSGLLDRLQIKPCYTIPNAIDNSLTQNHASSSRSYQLPTTVQLTTPSEGISEVVGPLIDKISPLNYKSDSSVIEKFITSNEPFIQDYSPLEVEENYNWNYHTQNLYNTFEEIHKQGNKNYDEGFLGLDDQPPHLEISTGQFLNTTFSGNPISEWSPNLIEREGNDRPSLEGTPLNSPSSEEDTIQGNRDTSPPSTPPDPPDTPPIENPEMMAQPGAQPRILNISPYPLYQGLVGTDPDRHLDRFCVVARANQLPQNLYLTTFPSTLIDGAGDWYAQLPAPPETWDELRTAFLTRFRPRSFIPGLIDRIRNIKMNDHEGIDSYYTRMNALLRRWHNHNMPADFLVSTFIGGVWPETLRIHLREHNPPDLATAYALAKTWEEARVNTDYAQYEDPYLYPTIKNSTDQMYGMDAYGRDSYPQRNTKLLIEEANPVYNPQPLAIKAPPSNSVIDSISQLERKFKELAVQVTNGKEKRQKPTNQRTNMWCTNCRGHGHLANECPTPLNGNTNFSRPKCTFCQGNHHTSKCWNLGQVVAAVSANIQEPVNPTPPKDTSKITL